MKLLREGKRTKIAGRDVGAGLKTLVRKLATGKAASSVPEFLARISMWETREADRMMKAKRPERVEGIHDQAEMLISLTEGVKSVPDVTDRIDALFTDDGLGQAGVITCSSVHRSKGLEANRVFICAWTLRSHNQEELNIKYVAFTRAIRSLVLVAEARKA
jgi:superfamily I DNA/RNA helicase